MGSYFAIRNITRQIDIFDSGARLYRRIEKLHENTSDRQTFAIFLNAPMIGYDWAEGYDPTRDQPPDTGISGKQAACEMDALLTALDGADEEVFPARDRQSTQSLLESLKAEFDAEPESQFAGYLIF